MKKSLIADVTLFLVAFVWGATFVVVQNAIAFLPPNTFNAVRFTLAAAFLLAVLGLFSRVQRRAFTPKLLGAGGFVGLWLFGGYALQTVGLMYTTPSKAAFITGLCVVLVPVFSFALLREKLKWPAVTGVLLAVAGLYLLTVGESLALSMGDLLVFGCALCFALQIVLTGKYAPHFPALPLAIVQLATVAFLSALYAACFENWRLAFDTATLLQPQVAWGLFITAIFATALAFLAQTAFQRQTTATRVALIFSLEPVFAALTAYVWIGDILTGRQVLGCVLIFTGMILAELPIAAWIKLWREPQGKAAEEESA